MRSIRSSPRSTAELKPRFARGAAQRAPSAARSPAHRAPSIPRPPAHLAPSNPASPASAAPRPAYPTRGPTGRRPDGPRLSRSVMPAPTAAPIKAAVRRSYCCSRSSSTSISGSDAGARFLPAVGSAFVVVPIEQILLVKCLVYSRLHSANGRRSRHERRLRFFLHHVKERVELLHAILRSRKRILQSLVHGGNRLTHLLHIDANGRRDVVDVVRDCACVPHQRIDVAVDLVEHVAHFLVALSEIPRCGNERD